MLKLPSYLLALSLCSLFLYGKETTDLPHPPSSAPHITEYVHLLKTHPKLAGPKSSWKNGEIEIVLDIAKIKKIENQVFLRLVSQGQTEAQAAHSSTVGIVAEDMYWIWIRDAVIFPSGLSGTYDRLIWKTGLDGPVGMAVLPVLSNHKIVVNIAYRHATRSWEIELPRGLRDKDERIEDTLKRELLEETGCNIEEHALLGMLSPDAGTVSSVVPIYFAKASFSGEKAIDCSEAITDNPCFTKEELKRGFSRGYIEYQINGKLTKIECRDAFLSYALFQAENKGHI